MKKKTYQRPTIWAVQVQHRQALLQASVRNIDSGDTGIKLGGAGSNSAARVKQNDYNVWDDDWSE